MARPSRAEEVRTERRRKAGDIAQTGMKFVYDESKLDRVNYEYRMVNDTKGRMQQLDAQDWDVAPEQALMSSTSGGTVQAKHAGVNELGSFNAVLMRKPKAMHIEDQKAKQTHLDTIDARIKSGELRSDKDLTGEGVYTPGAGNRIEAPSQYRA